jgi:hypothetical protein
VDQCGTRDGSQMHGRHTVGARGTKRKQSFVDEPFGITNKMKEKRLDREIDWERPGG